MLPREYEAVYNFDDELLVRVSIWQQLQKTSTSGKPTYRWRSEAGAWLASSDSDYLHLCSLSPSELCVRDVITTTETSPDTWLEVARIDAEALIKRAETFVRVLRKSQKTRSK